MAILYYLSNSGETSGPFTESEFQSLRDRGELKKYQLIWDGGADGWKPLAPPPLPLTAQATPTPEKLATASPPPAAKPSLSLVLDASRIEAVCFDVGCALNGKLERVTDTGCEFIAAHSSMASEAGCSFPQNGNITLNLLDAKTGRSMNVAAQMTGACRRNGNWTYQIAWKGAPEIVL